MKDSSRRFHAAQMMLANWPQGGVPVVERALEQWPLAGFVFHSQDIKSPQWLRETTGELWVFYKTQGWPSPWFAVTEEGGTVQRFRRWFDAPSAMSLGDLAAPGISYETGLLVGTFLLSCGINWNFAPVVDVLTEKYSHIVGTRSFGDNPSVVADHAIAWLLGQQAAGVVSTAKHFPGHGMTSRDSHVERPIVDLGKKELLTHLEPFRKTIDAGVQSVMTAHIGYPLFDERPATLSPFWLKHMLRDELGFQGVVITDAMSMKSIARHMDPVRAATEAVLAGADVIDCGGTFDQAIRMCEFLASEMNTLAVLERVRESERRIQALKAHAPDPSQWPSAPVPERLSAIYGQLTRRFRSSIPPKITMTERPVEIWVSGSVPTEVQEEAPKFGTDIVWLNAQDASLWGAKLESINERAQRETVILYAENMWKHSKLIDYIQRSLGGKIQIMVAVLDPVDEEVLPDIPVCIKAYGNRRVARYLVQSIVHQSGGSI